MVASIQLVWLHAIRFEKESASALYFANILKVYAGGLLADVGPGEVGAPRGGLA